MEGVLGVVVDDDDVGRVFSSADLGEIMGCSSVGVPFFRRSRKSDAAA